MKRLTLLALLTLLLLAREAKWGGHRPPLEAKPSQVGWVSPTT